MTDKLNCVTFSQWKYPAPSMYCHHYNTKDNKQIFCWITSKYQPLRKAVNTYCQCECNQYLQMKSVETKRPQTSYLFVSLVKKEKVTHKVGTVYSCRLSDYCNCLCNLLDRPDPWGSSYCNIVTILVITCYRLDRPNHWG